MHRPRMVLALVAIVMVVAAAACGSSANSVATGATPTQPTSTPRASMMQPSAVPRRFVSKRYDFSVVLDKGWSEVDASVSWDGQLLQGTASPAFANFNDAATSRTLVVAAAPVAKRTQLAQWRADMVRAAPSVCSESSSAQQTTLAGEPALTWTSSCSDGYDVHKLAALHGNRGYMVFLPSSSTNDKAVDRRVFDSVRTSFRFTR